MGGLLHWYTARRGLGGAAARPGPSSLYQNLTAHPSTASVPTSYYSMWDYNCLWSITGEHMFHHGISHSSPVMLSRNRVLLLTASKHAVSRIPEVWHHLCLTFWYIFALLLVSLIHISACCMMCIHLCCRRHCFPDAVGPSSIKL